MSHARAALRPRRARIAAGAIAQESRETDVAELMRSIARLQAEMPRDRIDPAVVVAGCGGDPVKLHAWVRDNTRAARYEGTLRGPLGVLMDRTGNSLDRALLLAHLLALAGYEARIVGAALAEGITPAGAAAVADSAAGTPRDPTRTEADAVAATLLAKIGPLSLAAPAGAVRHSWVQFEDRAGWVDLDPALPEAKRRRAEPEGEPIAFGLAKQDRALATETHSVTLRLLVERWEDGKLRESPALVVPFDAQHGPLASATLTYLPVDVKTSRASQRAFASGAELRKRLLEESAWAPVLVDGRNGGKMARTFDAAGVVRDIPKSFRGAGEVGNAARGAFGAMLGADAEAEPRSVLTALVAEYRIQVPRQPARDVRRFVFDSLGPEARRRAGSEALPRPAWTEAQRLERGAELAALHDTLMAFAGLPAGVYLHRYAQRMLDVRDLALQAAKGPLGPDALELLAHGLSLRSLELYAATRAELQDPALVIAEPQVLRRIVRYVPNADAQELDVQLVSDLAWNRLAPAEPSVPAAAFVAQGVLDTLQEDQVVLRGTPALPSQTNHALLMESARQGIEIVAFRDGRDPALAGFPAAARARILGDLEAGNVVVGPAKPVTVDGAPRLGWWRVDPRTGHTVGAMDTGFLQDTAEWTETHTVNGVRITRVRRMRVSSEAFESALEGYAKKKAAGANGIPYSVWMQMLRKAQEALSAGVLPPW